MRINFDLFFQNDLKYGSLGFKGYCLREFRLEEIRQKIEKILNIFFCYFIGKNFIIEYFFIEQREIGSLLFVLKKIYF